MAGLAGRFAKVGAFALGAGTFGVMRFAKSHAVATDAMAKLVRRSGLNLKAYQEIRHAANLAGVSQDTFANSMEKFTRNVGDAKAGIGTMTGLLKKTSPQLLKQIKNTTDNGVALELMLQAMGKLKDPTKRAALAAAVFGRAGVKMTLMLEKGPKAFKAARQEAVRLGGVLDKKATKAAEDYVDAMARMDLAMAGVKATIGNALLPILQPVIERFTAWAAANRDLISAKVAAVIRGVVKALRGIDWQKTGKWIGTAWDKIKGFGSALFKALKKAGAILAPFLKHIANLNVIMTALGVGVLAKVLISIGKFVAWIKTSIGTVKAMALVVSAKLAPAIGYIAGVFGALGRVLVTLPVKLLGVIALLFTDWEGLSNKLAELWPKIANGFIDAMSGARTGLATVAKGIWAVMVKLKNKLVNLWKLLWDKLTGFVTKHFKQLKKNVNWALEKVGLGDEVAIELPTLANTPRNFGGGASAKPGKVDLNIKFDNLPQAARVQAPKVSDPRAVNVKTKVRPATGTRAVGG